MIGLAPVGLVGVLVTLAAAPPLGAPESKASKKEVGDRLLEGVKAALANKKKRALRAFDEVAALHPRPEDIEVVRGMAWLVWGDHARARRALPETARWATYRAMAEMDTRGGLARATGMLAKAARDPSAPADVHFLVALGFARASQPAKADEHLRRALELSEGPLAPSWAPDPAVGLAEAAQAALDGLLPGAQVRLRLAERLLAAGRRGASLAWTRSLSESNRRLALAARARAMAEVDPVAAADAVSAWRAVAPDAPEVRLLLAEHALAEGETKRAAAALEGVHGPGGPLRARFARALTRLALAQDRPKEASRQARASLRAELESAEGRALLIRALLATKEVERAAEVAEDLLRRRPVDVDPFGLLAEVRAAQGRSREVEALKLRARGFTTDRARRRRLRGHAEKVFAAVRDARAGLGATGLTALRAQDPRFSLPIDLALAREGQRGLGRAARDRVLTACASALPRLLSTRGPWSRIRVRAAPYGKSEQVWVQVSAADPFRCRKSQMVRDTVR